MENDQRQDLEVAKLPDPLSTPELPNAPQYHKISEHSKNGKHSLIGLTGTFLWIMVLFGMGIVLSILYTKYEAKGMIEVIDKNEIQYSDESTASSKITETDGISGYNYNLLESVTQKPITGLTIRLPSEVLMPVCDGSGCASYGTYLSGGTRLTIATKAVKSGTKLSDVSIVDSSGNKFAKEETVIAGQSGIKFSGKFGGITTGGYRFVRMNGIMINIKPDLILEINHFLPSGIDADFDADAEVFERIVNSLIFTSK